MKRLYEVLVPTQFPNGKPVRTRHHKEWDKVVVKIAGGMTLMHPSRGSWISREGEEFVERMIPVRIACTRKQIERIMKFTIGHYRQLAVMAYLLSDEVIIMEADV